MKYLYYCNSLYQLITLLKLHFQRKENGFEDITNYSADLIMLNAFAGANDLCELLESKNIFNRIWLIDKNNNKKGHINTLINLFIPSTCIKDFGFDINEIKNMYDVIDTPKYSKIIAAIWQLNRKAELQLFDEGFASYENVTSLESHSMIYSKFYKYFNNGKTFYDYKVYYLNKKDMAVYPNDKHVEIPITKDEMNWLKELFSKIKGANSKKIFWFDQYYDRKDRKDAIYKTLKVLENYKDDVLFCPHPRKPIKSNVFENQVDKSLWEINVLNNPNINESCLITFNSTACLSPKILFDYEPYVIMTYSLIDSTKNIEDYVQKAKKIYRANNRVITPKNEEELFQAVDSII